MKSSNSLLGDDLQLLPAADKRTFLEQLLHEKQELGQLMSHSCRYLKFTNRLLDREICRVVDSLSKPTYGGNLKNHESLGPIVLLSEMVPIPVDKYPHFNFIGRILGPRGITAKKLEQSTGCKIVVRGCGSTRYAKKPDGEPLHVLIRCEDFEALAHIKIKRAIEAVNELLIPPIDGNDHLKRQQMVELAIIKGTHRALNDVPMSRNGTYPAPSVVHEMKHQSLLKQNVMPMSPKPTFTSALCENQLAALTKSSQKIHEDRTGADPMYKQLFAQKIDNLAFSMMSDNNDSKLSNSTTVSSPANSLTSPGIQTTPFTFGLTYEQVFGNGTVFSAMSGANQSNEATRTNLDQYLSMLNSEPFDNKM